MYEEVVQTKIKAPPMRDRIVARPRLIECLEAYKNLKLTLITAPAGFGKTTLLNEWACSTGEPVCWFSIDNQDNDLEAFWSNFLSAIRILHPDIGITALEMLASPQSIPTRAILTAVINEIYHSNRKVIIVLDDYHVIRNPSVQDSLAFLIDHMPRKMHLMIATRTQIPIPVGRLKIEGQLAEFNVDDLRFTLPEIKWFTEYVMGKKLDEGSIADLHAHSEGWAAGLQIAALSSANTDRENKPLLPEIQTRILDYFMDEVFAFLSEEIKSFLIETSILEKLNALLCDAVTGREDSASMLNELSASNMFIIPLDQRGFWHRYHHMFADLLKTRLAKTDPDHVRRLHRRASIWFRENKLRNEAIHHAVAAEDWDLAGRLVLKYGTIAILRGNSATALRWIRGLPGSRISRDPMLCLIYAWALFLTNLSKFSSMPFHTIEHLLSDAEKFFPELRRREGPDCQSYKALTAHVDALRVHLAYSRNEPRELIIELGNRTLEKFPENSVFIRSNIYFTLALTYLDTGDLESSSQSLEAARSAALIGGFCFQVILTDLFRAYLAKIRGRLHDSELIYHNGRQSVQQTHINTNKLPAETLRHYDVHKAALLFERNQLEEASALIDQAMESAQLLGENNTLQNSYKTMFLIRLFQGADGDAISYPINEIEKLAVHSTKARILSVVLRIRYLIARAHRKPENLQIAFGLADQYDLRLGEIHAPETQPYPVPFLRNSNIFEQLILIRLHLAENFMKQGRNCHFSADEISGHLKNLLALSRKEGFGELEIETLILLSITHNYQEDEEAAIDGLKTAIRMAEPEGYLRIFANEGYPLVPLLEKCLAAGFSVDYAKRIISIIQSELEDSSANARGNASLQDSSQQLSRQERTVLKLISRGLTNSEIADKLCIALTTVKTHNYRIFKKLNVSRRMDAAWKAKELKL